MHEVTENFLDELRRMPTETEWLEFKRAGQSFSFDQMAQYVSALANEANLYRREEGWLVMGIDDKIDPANGLRPATGTGFAASMEEINRIKASIAAQTTPSVVLSSPCVLQVPGPGGAPARVLLWRIPAAPRGMPVACKGHFWGRAGERLVALALHKLDTLRAQSALHDWSATVVSTDWQLVNHHGEYLTHQHFDLPLVQAIDALVARIRIIDVNVLPPREVAPLNLPNYDDWVIREALHNCVAHQDYAQGGRILVTESPDTLRFFNYGEFLPGSVEKVLHATQPEQRYRNACLANAMVELDLMETMNRGVKGMFRKQRDRFFPLPDFTMDSQPASVSVTIYGRTLDERYVGVLMTHTDLSLADAVLLDQIQKGHQPPVTQLQRLRAKGLIEGRSPKLRISAQLAVATGQEVQYLNQRRPDVQDYQTALCKLLALGPQPRTKIDDLLLPKLQLWIPELAKRKEYVRTLLKEMSKEGRIQNIGGKTQAARWALATQGGAENPHPKPPKIP